MIELYIGYYGSTKDRCCSGLNCGNPTLHPPKKISGVEVLTHNVTVF